MSQNAETDEALGCSMEASICSQDKTVDLYFVRPDEGASSPCLLAAHQACERFKSKWISAKDCLQMSPTKQEVFVCDPFEGKAFAHLTSGFKCVVVGPRCVLSCLYRTEPIPQLPSPIHNTAMRGLVITTTGFERARKEELKSMVERMAGIYSADYHMGITHLVANEVGTKKYQVAVDQEIPIMTGEWVSAVWNAVAKDHTQHILATDERFLSHACPVLYGMVVCVSQLDRATKLALQGIIEENGGTYSPLLEMSKTSVLIVSAPEGDKYTHACKWRIKCLTPDWIYDSVQRGHALQMENYEVKKRKHSTPNNFHPPSMLPSDLSQCSAITGENTVLRTSSVDETLELKEPASKERRNSFSKEVSLALEAMESLDLQEAQKAGLFLDGCKIFLSGFSNSHLEKLRRVLNFGGATRFSQLTEAVSHVVIAKPVEEHLALVSRWSTRPHLVYAHWITESIKLRRPAEEGQFTHALEEETVVEDVRRPQHSTTATATTSSLHNAPSAQCNGEVPHEDEVLRQYLKPGQAASTNTTAAASSSVALSDSQDRRVCKAFSNKTFTISGYTQDMEEALTEVVEERGGHVVPLDHPGPVHYSLITSEGQFHPKAEEVVSHYFLEDCITAKKLVPVEYYHVPLLPPGDTFPLEDCCITISTYTRNERTFLENLSILLGARSQDMFAKKPSPEKNVVPSTHLVCPLPSGNKYQAARKWGVPVVSADWLVECARVAGRVPEDPFLVNSSNHPKVDKKKVFKDHLGTTLKSREEEAGLRTSSSIHRPRNRKSGSCTPSPDKLHHSRITAEIHTSLRISRSQEDEAALDTSSHNPPHRKRLRRMNDSFLSQDPAKETPAKEFYKKFYEDIKETMKKYKRKPQLLLQESGTVKAATKDNRDREMEGEKEHQENGTQVEGPLKGVVVCSSRKFVDQWEEMSAAVEQLGGQYLSSYGPEVTHFLFLGRLNDINREFRRAKQDGKIIVAPDWLWMCQEKGTKVDEMLFPHTQNPNMSLALVEGSPNNRSKAKRKCPEGEVEEEEYSQEQNTTDDSEKSKEKDGTQEEKEKLSKQLEEIGALAQLTGKRTVGTRGRSKAFGEWHRHPTSRHVDIETQPMSGEELESQGTAITWEDPLEREARIHLQNQLNGDTQEHVRQVSADDTDESMKEMEEVKKNHTAERGALPISDETVANVAKSPDPQQLVFVLVGMSEEKRQHYSKVVEELGATVTLSPTFNPEVTHLVAESLSRSERTLAAIASGKWVLHDSYLDHSHRAGHFLKEELYAWGNPAAQHLPSLPPENTRAQLAKAAWRWRAAINGPDGFAQQPFQHMVALIHSSKDRVGAFTRMIKAGGGEVVTAKPPYVELEGITHFFAEMDKAPEKVDLEPFVARGIPCLKPIFINNYLIMDPLPEEEDHYISQYKDLLLSMSGNNQSGLKRLRKE